MWDVGFWIVVASSQENTQRRRQWLSYKNTAIFIYTRDSNPQTYIQKTKGLEPQNHKHIHQGNPNPKTKKHTLNKTKLLKQTRSNCVAQVSSRTLSQLLAACPVSRTTTSAPFKSGSTRG